MKLYRILGRRVRTHAGEIDLVARSPSGILCFIEVKARADDRTAMESVGPRQRARIERAASLYVAGKPDLARKGIRFDIVTVAPFLRAHPRCVAAMKDDPFEFLKKVGESGAGPHDIARAALMLAALDHPRAPLEPYLSHLQEIQDAMSEQSGLIQRVEDGARAVADLLAGRLGYDGDRLDYDNPRNADLMSVIERRRGLPVALGILYIHAARAGGMLASGLNTQSHFVLRLALRGEDMTIDPFHGGAVIDPGACAGRTCAR